MVDELVIWVPLQTISYVIHKTILQQLVVPSHQLSQCCHDWIVKSWWFMCNVCILNLKLTFWPSFSCILHKHTNIYKSKILSSVFNRVSSQTQFTHEKDIGIFSALAMEILQSCAKPWICVSWHEKICRLWYWWVNARKANSIANALQSCLSCNNLSIHTCILQMSWCSYFEVIFLPCTSVGSNFSSTAVIGIPIIFKIFRKVIPPLFVWAYISGSLAVGFISFV